MEHAAKRLAEQLIESFGPRALDHPRSEVVDLLADRGLNHDRDAIDAFFRYMEWLWEE